MLDEKLFEKGGQKLLFLGGNDLKPYLGLEVLNELFRYASIDTKAQLFGEEPILHRPFYANGTMTPLEVAEAFCEKFPDNIFYQIPDNKTPTMRYISARDFPHSENDLEYATGRKISPEDEFPDKKTKLLIHSIQGESMFSNDLLPFFGYLLDLQGDKFKTLKLDNRHPIIDYPELEGREYHFNLMHREESIFLPFRFEDTYRFRELPTTEIFLEDFNRSQKQHLYDHAKQEKLEELSRLRNGAPYVSDAKI